MNVSKTIGDKLLLMLLLVLVAGAVFYLGWLGPRQRAETVERLLAEAMTAYEQRDCATAAERFTSAQRRLGNDTLPTEEAAVEQVCTAFLEAPAGGIRRFLSHAVELVCAGRPLSLTDDLGRAYDSEFFGMIDTTAMAMWGGERVEPFIPNELRAEHVRDFRYAVCSTVQETRELERCTYTLYRGGNPTDVQLIRAQQLWRVRIIDITRRSVVARRSFWARNPGSCEENQSLLNRGTSIVAGSVDTARFAAWLRDRVP